MDLVGAWLRQLLGATTAAALVPLAIVAALVVVVAGAGGLGGLGSLGQVISGPEISPAREAAQRSAARGNENLAIVAPPAADGAQADVAARASEPATRPPGSGPATPPPPPPPRVATPRRPQGGRPLAPPPAAAPAPEPTPAAPVAEERPPTLKEEVDGTVDKVVVLLEDVVDNLGQTVGEILGGPGR